MNRILKAFWGVLLGDKIGVRFLIAVILSVAFSISIILSTIGLMDGFQNSLSGALRQSLGDVVMTNREGLFEYNDTIKKQLRESILEAHTSSYQIEGFLITESGERGVRMLSVRSDYEQVTGKKIILRAAEVAIGSDIAKSYGLSGGDEVEVAFVTGNSRGNVVPTIHTFVVKQIVEHGVYEKDSRMVYADRDYIEHIGLSSKDNIIFGLFSNSDLTHEQLKYKVWKLRKQIGDQFRVSLYGGEYQSLLKAVELEKVSISIILQIIVLVAVFNIAAFVTFISEKKSKDFFLLRALGISFKKIAWLWTGFVTGLWAFCCMLAIGLTYFFNYLLTNLSWLKLPGKIYVLSELEIVLSWDDYFIVFLGAGIWIFLVSGFALLRMSKKGLLGGLREEFA